jgi:hypothetical protein
MKNGIIKEEVLRTKWNHKVKALLGDFHRPQLKKLQKKKNIRHISLVRRVHS